jgi:hypothetical protein
LFEARAAREDASNRFGFGQEALSRALWLAHNAAQAEYVRLAALLLRWALKFPQLRFCATEFLSFNSKQALKMRLACNVGFSIIQRAHWRHALPFNAPQSQ